MILKCNNRLKKALHKWCHNSLTWFLIKLSDTVTNSLNALAHTRICQRVWQELWTFKTLWSMTCTGRVRKCFLLSKMSLIQWSLLGKSQAYKDGGVVNGVSGCPHQNYVSGKDLFGQRFTVSSFLINLETDTFFSDTEKFSLWWVAYRESSSVESWLAEYAVP
jgi:hypothetical protein